MEFWANWAADSAATRGAAIDQVPVQVAQKLFKVEERSVRVQARLVAITQELLDTGQAKKFQVS